MDIVGAKIGGSIATYKDVKKFPLKFDEIEERVLDFIRVEELKRIGKYEIIPTFKKIRLYLGLGAGPFGHYLVERWDELEDKSVVHKSCSLYCERVTEVFEEVGLPVIYEEKYSPMKTCFYNENGEVNIEKLAEWVSKEMENEKIPIFHGDMVPTKGKSKYDGLDVLSADKSVPALAIKLKAKRIVAGTVVDGLYADDPKKNLNAEFRPCVKSSEALEVKRYNGKGDVTGRIPEKVEEFKLAAKFGIEGRIVNALVENRLKKSLLGEECICTLILP